MSIAPSRVALIILAAGLSRRFGPRDKIAMPLRGRALGLHVADTLSQMDFGTRLAVIGADDPGFGQLGYKLIWNVNPERGMGHSIALGAGAAQGDEIGAVLIALADMPDVPASHIAAMLDRFDGDRLGSTDGSAIGPPALFGRAYFPSLCALTGDKGARDLLRGAPSLAAAARSLRDVDTPEDFVAISNMLEK